jgi:hypothetical protein
MATKVNLSSYAAVSGDSSPSLESARDAIITTGGQIYVDTASRDLLTEATLAPPLVQPVPLMLVGDGSNLLRINAPGLNAIQAVNVGLTIKDLIFRAVSTDSTYVDCARAILASSVGPMNIHNTKFFRMRASDSILQVGTAERVYLDTVAFLGAWAPNGAFATTQGASVYLNNCDFWDLGNLGAENTGVGKTQNSGSWIQLRRGSSPSPNGGTYFARADIRNSFFDEGVTKEIDIDGYDVVDIRRCGIKMSLASNGIGIHIKNVPSVTIKDVNIGAVNSAGAAYDRPLFKFENCGEVVIIRMTNKSRNEIGNPNPQPNPRVECDPSTFPNVRLIDSPTITKVQV